MGNLTLAPQQGPSAEQGYKGDPFEYVDGHYVGHDGFVVPNDFAEFYERFPDHIRRWVKRHVRKSSSNENIADWAQDLCAHLSSLPATSKYRRAGKRDVIQTFDPFRHYGATLPRFLNYINRCLANRFRTIHSEHMRNPLSRAEPLLCPQIGEEASSDDELCEILVEKLKAVDVRSRKKLEDRLLIGRFVEFVRNLNPRTLLALEAIAVTGTQAEAARKMGATSAEVGRLYRQIRELGRDFLNQKAGTRRSQCSETHYGTKANASTTESVSQPVQLSAESTTYWNRVDLYNEVWGQPLVKLSRKYGISDVRLGKVCRKLKIPHPGRGYWAKMKAGIAVQRLPLPEFKDAPVVRRMKTKNAAERLYKVSVRGQSDGSVWTTKVGSWRRPGVC
jgi:hypothetical protein